MTLLAPEIRSREPFTDEEAERGAPPAAEFGPEHHTPPLQSAQTIWHEQYADAYAVLNKTLQTGPGSQLYRGRHSRLNDEPPLQPESRITGTAIVGRYNDLEKGLFATSAVDLRAGTMAIAQSNQRPAAILGAHGIVRHMARGAAGPETDTADALHTARTQIVPQLVEQLADGNSATQTQTVQIAGNRLVYSGSQKFYLYQLCGDHETCRELPPSPSNRPAVYTLEPGQYVIVIQNGTVVRSTRHLSRAVQQAISEQGKKSVPGAPAATGNTIAAAIAERLQSSDDQAATGNALVSRVEIAPPAQQPLPPQSPSVHMAAQSVRQTGAPQAVRAAALTATTAASEIPEAPRPPRSRRMLRILGWGAVMGALAAGGVTVAVSTQHDKPHHVQPAPTPSTTAQAAPSPAATIGPQTIPAAEILPPVVTAQAHDPTNQGRPSNITHLSMRAITLAAQQAGLSKAEQTALSHNTHNISLENHAFITDPADRDNIRAGKDPKEWLYANRTYSTAQQMAAAQVIAAQRVRQLPPAAILPKQHAVPATPPVIPPSADPSKSAPNIAPSSPAASPPGNQSVAPSPAVTRVASIEIQAIPRTITDRLLLQGSPQPDAADVEGDTTAESHASWGGTENAIMGATGAFALLFAANAGRRRRARKRTKEEKFDDQGNLRSPLHGSNARYRRLRRLGLLPVDMENLQPAVLPSKTSAWSRLKDLIGVARRNVQIQREAANADM
jgi:hypothetical protein